MSSPSASQVIKCSLDVILKEKKNAAIKPRYPSSWKVGLKTYRKDRWGRKKKRRDPRFWLIFGGGFGYVSEEVAAKILIKFGRKLSTEEECCQFFCQQGGFGSFQVGGS